MRTKTILLALLLNIYFFADSSAQTMPLVYDVENTGASYPIPYLPSFSELPNIQSLPDPFEWADGRGRISNYSDWEYRRTEIGAQIQNYEIGTRPAVDIPSQVTASYSSGTLTVHVTANGQTLTLTCPITLPSGSGPFPAVIGMNSPSGSIPSNIFTSRNVALITYSHDQVTTYNNPQNTDPFYKLYGPGLTIVNTGQYDAWAWGVSRIIDGLELVQNVLPIDLKHIAVTGCSYAGKMALFAGAFDERVALTIAQESGGGGATTWRYSATQPSGSVEGLAQTSNQWFMDAMFQFGANVPKLPEDHHELMAMCAPRALYVSGNPDYVWLSNPSCYVASMATQQIYNGLGIGDRFGYSIIGGHTHCQVPDSQLTEVGAFVDKFLLGKDSVNTNIADTPYNTDLSPWITWTAPTLASGTSFFGKTTLASPPNLQKGLDTTSVTFKWNAAQGAGKYRIELSIDPAFNSIQKYDSTTDTLKTYTGLLLGEQYYWRVQVENSSGLPGPFSTVWGFSTFAPLPTKPLVGSSLQIQPDGITLSWNKVQYANQYLVETSNNEYFTTVFASVSTSDTVLVLQPLTQGQQYFWRVQASNVTGSSPWSDAWDFTLTDVKVIRNGIPTVYSISQNYPNPFNPTTKIDFALPQRGLTKIIIYDLLGRDIQTLINRDLEAGYHEVNVDAGNFPSGVYFYRLQSGDFIQTKKMILMK
ncbi:MAG: T9SS type A sorting domain-containing protein [Bacteroidota bacterium]